MSFIADTFNDKNKKDTNQIEQIYKDPVPSYDCDFVIDPGSGYSQATISIHPVNVKICNPNTGEFFETDSEGKIINAAP
jgi:hypothetical protein